MTYTNQEALDKAMQAFHRLSVNDQIAALASLYREAAGSLSAAGAAPSQNVTELLQKVKELREENQLQFLQDLLSQKQNQQAEVALDPHPSKAMLELIPGAGAPPISQYNELSQEDRLAFWYAFAKQMGNGIIAPPADYQPSEQVTEVLNSLKSSEFNQQIEFLRKVV
jgi:ribosomal protein S16